MGVMLKTLRLTGLHRSLTMGASRLVYVCICLPSRFQRSMRAFWPSSVATAISLPSEPQAMTVTLEWGGKSSVTRLMEGQSGST